METQNTSQGFMATLESWFVTKAPFQIPANLKEIIVKYGPWLIVLLVLTLIPGILMLLGLGVGFGRMLPYAYMGGGWSIHVLLNLVGFALCLLALPGLFKRSMSGWTMLFYSQIVSFASSLLYGDILGAILGVIIGFYILFQVKSYYH